MEIITYLPAILLCWAIYLLPSLVAMKYRHHNMASILVINLALGWTLVAWVLCFAWALSKRRVTA